MNPAKSQQSCDTMSQLMGEGLNHFYVLAQIPIHNGEYDCSKSEPEKPRIIASLVITKPFCQVAKMMRQRGPDFGYEEDTEKDENDTKQYAGTFFHASLFIFILSSNSIALS